MPVYINNRLTNSPKNNFTATRTPTTSDNASQGYDVGSQWVYSGASYTLIEFDGTDAVWKRLPFEVPGGFEVAVPTGGGSYADLVGEPPFPHTYDFQRWEAKLLMARLAYCPVARTTLYYAAASSAGAGDGSDSSNPGTLADALTAMGTSGGDFAILLKRGDEFEVSASVDMDVENCTLAAYGNPEDSLPLIHCFDGTLLAADDAWAADDGGGSYPNRYKITSFNAAGGYADTVEWVRETGDRLSPYRYRNSAANVGGTDKSWYYDAAGDVLWINAAGDDPNDIDYEYTSGLVDDGVFATADGVRIDSIRCDGFGVSPTAENNYYGIRIGTGSGDLSVVSNCESYYTGRHAIEQISSGSGLGVIVNCRAGYTSGDDSVFGLFSSGSDYEGILWGCVADYGHLPDEAQSHGDSGTPLAINHSVAGETVGLVIVAYCECSPRRENTYATWSNGVVRGTTDYAPGDNTLSTVRVFVHDNRIVADDIDEGSSGIIHYEYGTARWNNEYILQCSGYSRITGNGWAWNDRIDMTCEFGGTWRLFGDFGTGNDDGPIVPKLAHCSIVLRPGPDQSANNCYLSPGSTGDVGDAATLLNCVIVADTREAFDGTLTVYSQNFEGSLEACAYHGLSASQYNEDTDAVVLDAPPSAARPAVGGLSAGVSTVTLLGSRLEYDRFGRPRSNDGITIGPVESAGVV